MSNYNKGARGERELIDLLEGEDFVCLRAPASGAGTERELPDVLAGDGDRLYVFEVKRWSKENDYEYLSKEEVHDLEYYAEGMGAKSYIAVRFDYGDWGFFEKEEMKETQKNYRCDRFKKAERGIDDICQL